ncbi:MAG: NADH-quinone oxidoreductase subunit H [Anaerolineae bacterium]|nr:NADH-quinone oxidoreductase subunit H [Anaerolineae bacterium]
MLEILRFLSDFFVNAGALLQQWFHQWGLSAAWSRVVLDIAGSLIIVAVPFTAIFFLIWVTRKVIARIQDRLGPNNSGTWAGPFALFQTVADAIKILTKEFIVPIGADKSIFFIAPIFVLLAALAIWVVVPFGPSGMQGADLSIGIFYVVSISSLALFSIVMAGWSSRNKYAIIGAFRGVSQIVSYEIPQVLAILPPVMLTGSLSMQDIVMAQDIPYIVSLPVPAFIFLLAVLAEIGRLPLEQAEADAEIVAGYFTEYSGMMFGAFYLAEFINNFAAGVIFATLFLGGWRGPFVEQIPVLGAFWLLLKAFLVFLIFCFFWGAMPRLRIDHILSLNWKFLVPLALVTLPVLALSNKLLPYIGVTSPWGQALCLLGVNIAVAAGAAWSLTWVDDYVNRQSEELHMTFVMPSVAPEFGDLLVDGDDLLQESS